MEPVLQHMLCKACCLFAISSRLEPTVPFCTCAGKQAKDEALDRLLWRGVLQGHHCGHISHSHCAANDGGTHAWVAHPARSLLQSHGLLDHCLPLCLGISASGLCLCNRCCHIQVRFVLRNIVLMLCEMVVPESTMWLLRDSLLQ